MSATLEYLGRRAIDAPFSDWHEVGSGGVPVALFANKSDAQLFVDAKGDAVPLEVPSDILEVGAFIARTRRKFGLSQRSVAAAANIRFETLCRIEQGKRKTRWATLMRVLRALRSEIAAKVDAAFAQDGVQ